MLQGFLFCDDSSRDVACAFSLLMAVARPMPDDTPVIRTILYFDVVDLFRVTRQRDGDQFYEGVGLILNQMEYIAGRNTSVRIVPANVPPMSV